MQLTRATLRTFAVDRSLFPPTTLRRAIEKLGFVQADPIRAPARAQDLTLRHRVRGYQAGDLERHYPSLSVEEDTFINYGFVSRAVYDLMHPRGGIRAWTSSERARARSVLAFVQHHGSVHPRELDRQFGHGLVTNDWGGISKATTQILDLMHYRGLLRIAAREGGIRTYAMGAALATRGTAQDRARRLDSLIDVLVGKYAPLSRQGLSKVARRLRYATPQWRDELGSAITRALTRLAHARVDGVDWFWPATESLEHRRVSDQVRLLTPFDPVVWDRDRFEMLWGWKYRFEAYVPPVQRERGYYALPLLWRDTVIGWANVGVTSTRTLEASFGYVTGTPPRGRAFKAALDDEVERLREFLKLP